MRLRSVGERSAMLFMRVGFRLDEDARWRLNVKSHRAVRIGTSGHWIFCRASRSRLVARW